MSRFPFAFVATFNTDTRSGCSDLSQNQKKKKRIELDLTNLVVTSSRLVRVRARSISCSHTPDNHIPQGHACHVVSCGDIAISKMYCQYLPCVELEEGREPTLLIPDAQVL